MQNFTQSFSQDVAGDEIANLIGTEDVAGMPVFDLSGRRLGWIEEVMFDKFSGKATYAVVAAVADSGRKHPIPWSVMRYAEDRGGYDVDIDAESFDRAPSLSADGHSDWSDAEMRRKILDYYKRPIAV